MDSQILNSINEIRDLLRLIAEPKIAELDQKHRDELLRIVGSSKHKAACTHLMKGSLTQTEIRAKVPIDKGGLSRFVKQLTEANLLKGDILKPELAISIPSNFFEE